MGRRLEPEARRAVCDPARLRLRSTADRPPLDRGRSRPTVSIAAEELREP